MPRLITQLTEAMRPPSRAAFGVHDPESGRTYFWEPGDDALLLVGRSQTCDIRLDDLRVSKTHAIIRAMRDGGVILRDHNSTNGTFIDGEPVDGPVVLRTGMQIYLGGHAVLVATDEAGEFPIEAYNIQQFCHFGRNLYGSENTAEDHLGKSRRFITTHANKWRNTRDRLRTFFRVTH